MMSTSFMMISVFAVELDLGARPLAEQHRLAALTSSG
jgi:hypothetical protein